MQHTQSNLDLFTKVLGCSNAFRGNQGQAGASNDTALWYNSHWPLLGHLQSEVVQNACKPSLNNTENDSFWVALIVLNELLFLTFIVLRAIATKGWLSIGWFKWFTHRHSLRITAFSTVLSLSLSAVKVVIALSFQNAQTEFSGASTQNVTGFGLSQNVAFLSNASAAGNCSEIQLFDGENFVTVFGPVLADASTGKWPHCTVPILCGRQCTVQASEAIYVLCFVYLFSSSYIAYLAFEFHKMVVLGGADGKVVLEGEAAMLAMRFHPVIAHFPDVSALIKFLAVVVAMFFTYKQSRMVKCAEKGGTYEPHSKTKGGHFAPGKINIMENGPSIQAGCAPFTDLSESREYFLCAVILQGAYFVCAIVIKQKMLWRKSATLVAWLFALGEVLLLAVQGFLIAEIELLELQFNCSTAGSPFAHVSNSSSDPQNASSHTCGGLTTFRQSLDTSDTGSTSDTAFSTTPKDLKQLDRRSLSGVLGPGFNPDTGLLSKCFFATPSHYPLLAFEVSQSFSITPSAPITKSNSNSNRSRRALTATHTSTHTSTAVSCPPGFGASTLRLPNSSQVV